jgi:DNA-binding NarL/FixJ family response regulator
MSAVRTRILVVDDHDLMRRGIKSLLQPHSGWEICGEAQTGREAVEKTAELKPDVVILDISMPDLNGVEAARRIRKSSPNTEVLILSVHYSDQLIREILAAGVRGYVIKSLRPRSGDRRRDAGGPRAFFHVARDGSHLGRFQREPISRGRTGIDARPAHFTGTRSRAVARRGQEQQGSRLISGHRVKTAETHRANIMRKLQLHEVTDLVRYAVRNQIIEA